MEKVSTIGCLQINYVTRVFSYPCNTIVSTFFFLLPPCLQHTRHRHNQMQPRNDINAQRERNRMIDAPFRNVIKGSFSSNSTLLTSGEIFHHLLNTSRPGSTFTRKIPCFAGNVGICIQYGNRWYKYLPTDRANKCIKLPHFLYSARLFRYVSECNHRNNKPSTMAEF